MNNVLVYLEKTALKYPSKTAVADENTSISFAELLVESQQIGSFLCGKVKRKTPIPVFMEKGVDTLKTFFGVIYSGCFYVLINPELPTTRIEQILDTLNVDFVVSCKNHMNTIACIDKIKNTIYLEDIADTLVDDTSLRHARKNSLDTDPLYVNFTSGSTGVPKGVVISHRSVIDFIEVFTNEFNITNKDIIGNQAPFDFDVSVKDIYSSIKTGATLQIIPKKLFSSPILLADFLCDRKITTLIWAVSALCLISTFHVLDYKLPKNINKVLFSGEIMPLKHLRIWMIHFPKALFVNLYGPTEITCNCTYYIVKNLPQNIKALPIGRAFSNEKVFLLDSENNEVVKSNINGEICVLGSTLALGYYNNTEETSKRFIQNPLNRLYNETIYLTGDLGYYDEYDNLYFAGRKDFQIKYQGHRIELEEIEAAISKVNGVSRACCIFKEEKSKLIAFYVGKIDSKQIREKLKLVLPSYMLPTVFYMLTNLPLNVNGKIDRKILMKMYDEKRV